MSWFVMQCIACAIEHLPITHLEIVTLAYAAMNFVIYVFWWNKPLNVDWPVQVFRKLGESELSETQPQPISGARKSTWELVIDGLETIFRFIAGSRDDFVNLSCEDRVPRFWANSTADNAWIADIIVLGIGICFGAIHCIAWGFPFPTHTELQMWRISCVVITAVPIYIPFMAGLAVWMNNMDFNIIGGIVFFFGFFLLLYFML